MVGRALKSQEPNWVLSSWSIGLRAGRARAPVSWSTSAGLLWRTSPMTPLDDASEHRRRDAADRHPAPRALGVGGGEQRVPFCAAHASQ